MKERPKRSLIWMIDKTDLEHLVQKSFTYSEVLSHFNLNNKGGNVNTLKNRLNKDNITINHFDPYKNNGKQHKQKDIIEMLTKNSTYSRGSLKIQLIKRKLIPYICQLCNQEPFWKEKPLSLILDHINGVSNDNSLENLRFLCPNCNAQTDTFGSKNTKNRYYKAKISRIRVNNNYVIAKNKCICGQEKLTTSLQCIKCASIKREKINWPDTKELIDKVKDSSYTKVAKELGVSDKAVAKRIKNHSGVVCVGTNSIL